MNNRYEVIEHANASEAVQKIYDETKRDMGIPFVLNWFKCQGNNPTLLRGNWEKLRTTLIEGDIPNVLKQIIIHKVSKDRGCDYCAHAHGLLADAMGKQFSDNPDFRVTENLNSEFIPKSYRTAIEVISRCALNPANTSEEDFEALKKEGFTAQEIQELFSQADLVNMLNTIAEISGIKVDNELLEIEN